MQAPAPAETSGTDGPVERVSAMSRTVSIAALLLAATPAPLIAGPPGGLTVERSQPDRLRVRWTSPHPVDVYMADRPDAAIGAARLVSADDRDGVYETTVPPRGHPYFFVRDHRDGAGLWAAERLIPLERGSNFRDVGGYPAAGGKHVRWGMIYRSAATPLLGGGDLETIGRLGLTDMVDLRSSEERQLAPTRIGGVAYHAVGYSIRDILSTDEADDISWADIYRRMPEQLAPQMRLLFRLLLAHQGPLAYNCSAGQDRTGFATALILTALGVPRDTILADYHLSTRYRRPAFEMPKFDPAAFPDNAAARLFSPADEEEKPHPLLEPDGTPFLSHAIDEIERRYGSLDNYLEKRIGIDARAREALRARYLD